MEQTGYVTKVSDGRIKVRVIRESSCGGNCVSCKGCPSGIQLIECAAYDGAAARWSRLAPERRAGKT